MALTLKEAKKLAGFSPSCSANLLHYVMGNGHSEIRMTDPKSYARIRKLISGLIPLEKSKFDTRWNGLYAPLRNSGRFVAVPISVMEYKKEFFLHFFSFNSLTVGVRKNRNFPDIEDTELLEIYRKIIQDMEKLMRRLRANPGILEKIVPYDYRTGKISGKFVLEKILPTAKKQELSALYQSHLQKNLTSSPQSLEDYLRVAGICYKKAYGEKANGLSDLEMYGKWADGRHGGMLDIKDAKSPAEFEEWHRNGRWIGCHPYEIVFSWHRHGILLSPPTETETAYSISVSNYAYAGEYVLMVQALIENGSPFKAFKFEEVLSFLSGETFFGVNDHSEHSISYFPCAEDRKNYFRHIEWDALKLPAYKQAIGKPSSKG